MSGGLRKLLWEAWQCQKTETHACEEAGTTRKPPQTALGSLEAESRPDFIPPRGWTKWPEELWEASGGREEAENKPDFISPPPAPPVELWEA